MYRYNKKTTAAITQMPVIAAVVTIDISTCTLPNAYSDLILLTPPNDLQRQLRGGVED